MRSRFLSPETGRFLTKDTWQGDYNRPASLNKWNYVESNSVNYTDPSGFIRQGPEAQRADNIRSRLNTMGIVIVKDWGDIYTFDPNSYKISTCGWDEGRWGIKDLVYIEKAARDLNKKIGGPSKLRAAVGQVVVNKINRNSSMMSPPPDRTPTWLLGDIVILTTASQSNEEWYKFTFVHEFGHVWDYRQGSQISMDLEKELGAYACHFGVCYWDPSQSVEAPPDTLRICKEKPNDKMCEKPPYSSTYGNSGPLFSSVGAEDWAQSLAYFVYPDYQSDITIGLRSVRRQFVKKQISYLH